MDRVALYIVRQNYFSTCIKCKLEKKYFAVYRCGKCEPQTIEKYCYECCEKSCLQDEEEISVLCMGCAFCYDYINVTKFFQDQKNCGWQGLKYDCLRCSCCCDGDDCIAGSLCCVSDSETEDEEKKDEEKN